MKFVLLFCAVVAMSANDLAAQSCQSNPAPCSTNANQGAIEITIGRAFQLGVAPLTSTLTTPTPADYSAGYAASNGPTLTVRSNAVWTLGISAFTAVWSAVNTETEPARIDKPAGDLTWSTAAAGPFTAATTTPATFASGSATGGTAVSIFYRTLYAWNLDTPGTYNLTLVFTITAP